jgi:YVTN family beta-propeller protein
LKTIPLRHLLVAGKGATLIVPWLCMMVLASLVAPRPAYADGGAPNLAYVAGGGAGGGDLVVIDIGQRQVRGRIHLGGEPEGVVLSVDGSFAYVTQRALDRLAIVDAHEQRVVASVSLGVGAGPSALALVLSQRGAELYVTNSGRDTVSVVDPDGRRVRATIPVGVRPMGLAVAGPDSGIGDPSDAEVYVANEDGDTVSVISATQHRVVATIAVPGGPVSVVVPATGGIAYVATRSGDIVALSLADHRRLGTALQLQAGAPGTMDYDAVTGQVYVPDAATGTVDILAPVSLGSEGAQPGFPHEPVRTIPVGGGPSAVAITFDGAYGFVAQRNAGRVAALDMGDHHVLANIDVGGAPQAIVTGPYPPAVSGPTAFIVDMLVFAFLLVMMGWALISGRSSRPKRVGARDGTPSTATNHGANGTHEISSAPTE